MRHPVANPDPATLWTRQLFPPVRDQPVIRLYRAGDEGRILELFERSFHNSRSVESWNWKYRQNPYGNLKISLAFAHDGDLLAHYAAYPCRFHDATSAEPRSILAHQIGDTMTSRRALAGGALGRPRLLQAVTRQFFDRFCHGQVGFNYGFNTGKIQRYYLRLVPGSRFFEAAAHRVLSSQGTVAARRRRTTAPSIRVTRVREVDARWEDFFRRVAPDYRLLLERDSRYLSWRYLACPDADYSLYSVFRRETLVGWGVFRRRQACLTWGDALFDRRFPEAPEILLGELLRRPENRAVRRVEGWFPTRPGWWDKSLLALGFVARPEPQDLGMIYKQFEEADLAARFGEHLYYTKGDGDLF